MTLSNYRFKSNYLINGLGFNMSYEVQNCGEDDSVSDVCTPCSNTYSDVNGVLTSPGFDRRSGHWVNCTSIIIGSNNSYINIVFHEFVIQCRNIYLDVRDGPNEDSPLVGRFCGDRTNTPRLLQSTQNYMWIRYLEYSLPIHER